MRWIAAATLVLLVACENRIVTSSPTGISIEGGDFARDGTVIAEAHCAQFGKTPRLKAVEPMTHLSWINHYDCI